jgi:hypothetical protein
MKHATVKIGEYTIPLIGIDPSATLERCDQCRKSKHLSAMKITMDGKRILCVSCRYKNLLKGLRLHGIQV